MTKLEPGTFVITSGGHILFKRRGKAPNLVIEGYIQDKNDPYVYVPDFRDCDVRKEFSRQTPCGKQRVVHICTAQNDKEVNNVMCEECDLINEEGHIQQTLDFGDTEDDADRTAD